MSLRRLRQREGAHPRRPGPQPRPRAWIVPVAALAAMYAVSFLTLPAVAAVMHERAVGLGWL